VLRKNDRTNLNLQKNIFLKRISFHFFSKLEYFLYGWRSLNSEFFVIKKLAGKIKNFLLDYCFSVLFFFNKNYFLSGVKLVLFFLNLVKIIEINLADCTKFQHINSSRKGLQIRLLKKMNLDFKPAYAKLLNLSLIRFNVDLL
jgi:hypothetical protein